MYLSVVYSLTIYKRIKEPKNQILVPNLEEVKKYTKRLNKTGIIVIIIIIIIIKGS